MIEMYTVIKELENGKTETTVHVVRGDPTIKERIECDAIVEMIAHYISLNAGDGTTMVHRPLPPPKRGNL